MASQIVSAPRMYHGKLSNATSMLEHSRQMQMRGYASHDPLVIKPFEEAQKLLEEACTGNTAQELLGLWEANPLASNPQELDAWRLEETFLVRLEQVEHARRSLAASEANLAAVTAERRARSLPGGMI